MRNWLPYSQVFDHPNDDDLSLGTPDARPGAPNSVMNANFSEQIIPALCYGAGIFILG